MSGVYHKRCGYCGREFDTEYPTKIYCNKVCAQGASHGRDESFYDFAHDGEEPLYEFECANCGKRVQVWSKYDQRTRYCCGRCAYEMHMSKERMRLTKNRPTNLGMSGGMSLGSLIRLEARSVDRSDTIYVNKCPECGRTFETAYSRKIYCSNKCKDHAQYTRKAARRNEKMH